MAGASRHPKPKPLPSQRRSPLVMSTNQTMRGGWNRPRSARGDAAPAPGAAEPPHAPRYFFIAAIGFGALFTRSAIVTVSGRSVDHLGSETGNASPSRVG